MTHKYTVVNILGLVAIASLSLAADGRWAFNHNTGQGKISKAPVVQALGHDVTYEEAQGLVFTSVDTVDGCRRERLINTIVTQTGNPNRNPKVVGFYALGYVSDGGCGSAPAGPDATLYVNGIPIQ